MSEDLKDALKVTGILTIGAVFGTAAASLVYLLLATVGWWPTGETASYYTALFLGAGGAMVGMVAVGWFWGRRL